MPSFSYKKFVLLGLSFCNIWAQVYTDVPFSQDRSIKFQNTPNQPQLSTVSTDQNQNILVLSSAGLLAPWKESLKPNYQYRPLENMAVLDIANHKEQFYFLNQKAVFSFSHGAKFYVEHGIDAPLQFAMGRDGSFLVLKNNGGVFKDINGRSEVTFKLGEKPISVIFDRDHNQFFILTSRNLFKFQPVRQKLEKVYKGSKFTAIEFFENKIWLGTSEGIKVLSHSNFLLEKELDALPHNEITSLKNIDGVLWAGSTKGAFRFREDNRFDYYASKRWLLDDAVKTIEKGPENSVLILSKQGLNQIVFEAMTLEQKADYFQKIQRQRHIRYGLESSVVLKVAGDLSTSSLIDTDNDGLWTSMYMAAELFRFAVTQKEEAKRNAIEAFEAMERLTSISNIKGFPARTFEWEGHQRSDWKKGDSYGTWKEASDEKWVWKTTTSSDESCGHFFVYALFAEIIQDEHWKKRAIKLIKDQMDHIIDNNWYLVSWDGKPTRWGRWHPDYVNSFPIQVGDRRLNSTLILAFLQTAYHFTGDNKYKNHALKLERDHGYEENATRPANVIDLVKGEMLSDAWNHSDDEMYFLTAPAFVKYAFDEESKKHHLQSVATHWEIERSEKNPLWNFLYAISGGEKIDLEDAVWWLKEYPLDLIDWKVENSHRKDLKKVAENFRKQEYESVLPRDERPHHLHNRAYQNNGGSGGFREYSPYVYLLPYWAGRYSGAILPME